jgi:hypothetical protein
MTAVKNFVKNDWARAATILGVWIAIAGGATAIADRVWPSSDSETKAAIESAKTEILRLRAEKDREHRAMRRSLERVENKLDAILLRFSIASP